MYQGNKDKPLYSQQSYSYIYTYCPLFQLAAKEKFEYPPHVSPAELKRGLTSGKYLQGSFRASRDNYLEGEVMASGQDKPVFIQGEN